MTYENVYVAQIASGANQMQTIKAFEEAEKFPGPSIIIAYMYYTWFSRWDESNVERSERRGSFRLLVFISL